MTSVGAAAAGPKSSTSWATIALVGRRRDTPGASGSEPEQRRRDAVGSAHVVYFAERSEMADRRAGQPVVTPERLGIHGHHLDHVAHPHRRGGGECGERFRQRRPEGDPVDGE
jgi:hypothetical protein